MATITVLMLLHGTPAQAAAWSAWLAGILEGTPIELGQGGTVSRATMHRHSVSQRDLEEAPRQSSLEEVGTTRRVVLEPSDKIDVLKS